VSAVSAHPAICRFNGPSSGDAGGRGPTGRARCCLWRRALAAAAVAGKPRRPGPARPGCGDSQSDWRGECECCSPSLRALGFSRLLFISFRAGALQRSDGTERRDVSRLGFNSCFGLSCGQFTSASAPIFDALVPRRRFHSVSRRSTAVDIRRSLLTALATRSLLLFLRAAN